MTKLEDQIDTILADPLAPARQGGRALGYVGLDIPADLLAASGRYCCHLPWTADRPAGKAAEWLEASFAPWAFSILDDWAEGRFDFMDAVIFSRGDDNAQRLYYYICELQRRGLIGGPEALMFDIARIPRESSLARTTVAVAGLARRLDISQEALRHGITTVNARRALFEGLEAARTCRGDLYENIARASLFADIGDCLEGAELPRGHAAGRILLAGTMPPDDRLHRAVETTGWTISGEAHDGTLLRLGPAIAADCPDPATAIATQLHGHFFGPRSFGDRGAWLVAHVRRARADAVILWLTEEEEALVWHVPGQRKALAAANIPVLVLTRRQWGETDGVAAEIAAFVREVAA